MFTVQEIRFCDIDYLNLFYLGLLRFSAFFEV